MWLDAFLFRNPLAFPKLTPRSQIRIAKTKMRIKGAKVFPSYKLLFTADEATRTVIKLHVSICNPEEMAHGDPWDDDEPPF